MKVADFKNINYDKDDETGIVTVTINRPEIKNALAVMVLYELYRAVDAIETDPKAKAMILTGAKSPEDEDPANEAFSSGGYFNLADLEALDEETKSQIDLTDIAQKKLCLKLWQLDKPVIAAINGLAIGGGFTIPLACADLIYISEHAWVRLPFISLGLIPELASSYLLPRLVGFQRAKEIFFFGEKLPASTLYDMGLVNEVVAHEELLAHAKQMALKLIPPLGAGLAARLAKKALHGPLIEAVTRALDAENEGLNQTIASADFWEAIAARKEKRDPVFKGE
ncbi:MAG: enoyl-CoA hydratase/isomerase family protein [Deltaproteobacteria bacterium]|jgi:2-(1,2-epoxy-1,2-dihydrophenyl)acetyl-CoA isomerase|nr:enoyl-CoA hydratase/isomerase family protein [Deltaproteobacteria bacterium]